jgi:hypothetical protein
MKAKAEARMRKAQVHNLSSCDTVVNEPVINQTLGTW